MHIKTDIIINAPKAQVWHTLIDIELWQSWNPFIVQAIGEVKVGSRLTNTLLNNGKPMQFKPVVTEVMPNQKFAWLGSAFMGGFKGEHYFILEEVSQNQTKLTHGEVFSGWLAWLIFPIIKQQTQAGFQSMNEAMKTQLEN